MSIPAKPRLTTAPGLPLMPWEEQPSGQHKVFWRYSGNPIVQRYHIPTANSIFNSAVVPFQGGYAGVFRVDDKRHKMQLHRAHSVDGIRREIDRQREVAALVNGETGRLAVYQGAAHTVECLAFAYIDEVIDFVKANSRV